ncbi:vacuolar protein sorting-associated protein VTA1 homolog [Liolophura sinensis]|uniref:vacuolar protein sorting-associated protein VTA1 homolog n=1 Tax=Liolophura sinensis TaxID=3198878 RepID=UPI0031588814
MQKGMEADRKSPEGRAYLVGLMDYLEKFKTQYAGVEAVHNEIVGQAHFEDYALKVFLYADNEDRAGRFNKSVVRSFFTAGLLFDVLSVFGELSEDVQKNRKYAKWKATYIHKCLQSGEQPVPGPVGGDDDEIIAPAVGFEGVQPGPSHSYPDPTRSSFPDPSNQPSSNNYMQPPAGTKAPPSTPQDPTQGLTADGSASGGSASGGVSNSTDWTPPPNPAGIQLTATQMQKAMKYSNYASSALRYDDSKTAIDYLTKALKLLTTGVDTGS